MININPKILPKGVPFTVAISGGCDSLACIDLLSKINYGPMKAIHYNHNQKPQNDLMEDACKRFCDSRNIELLVGKCDVKYDKNIEDNLRNERLKFFSEVGGIIVLCHHLSDCVESYLMNCFKGIPEYLPIPHFTEFYDFIIVRPFLKNSKKRFIDWVVYHKLEEFLVVDETNSDSKYERNWIRNEIITKIEERRGLEKVVLKKFYL